MNKYAKKPTGNMQNAGDFQEIQALPFWEFKDIENNIRRAL